MFKNLVAAILAFCAAAALAAVDVNQASQAELESIKGIGPSVSGRMLEERAKKPFADWADMETRVKGVGPGNAAKFSAAGLTLNGAAYTTAPKVEKPAKVAKVAKEAKAEKPAKPAKGDARSPVKP